MDASGKHDGGWGEKPEFIEKEIAFRINLYRSQTGLTTDQATNQTDPSDQVTISFGKEERQLIHLIVNKPEITQKEMAKKLEWRLSKVKYYITKLKKNHVLERVGTSQKGQWNVLVDVHAWQDEI